MRKIVYLLFLPLAFAANTASAQSITADHDTVASTIPVYTDIYNYIHNNSGMTTTFDWKVLSHTLPQSWVDNAAFGLCDNVTCYGTSILSGSTQTTDTFGNGSKCLFKLQMDGSASSVTPGGPYFINVEVSEGSTTDTVTFSVVKFTTGVTKVSIAAKDDVIVYPNPARNEVNVTFSKDAGVKSVAVYNLVGKQMMAYRTTGNSAKLDIDKIPSGIYFIRLMDGNGQVVTTRRFTHQ